jgi:hypothetical protein
MQHNGKSRSWCLPVTIQVLLLPKSSRPVGLLTFHFRVGDPCADAPVRRNEHVRHCSILYYLEDGTIQVSALPVCDFMLRSILRAACLSSLILRIWLSSAICTRIELVGASTL